MLELEELKKENIMLFYGVGNHGGGPTKQIIEEINRIKNKYNNVEIIMSTVKEYIKTLKIEEKLLEKIEGELQYHANGCYSVNPNLKDHNMKAEQLLMTAEKFSTITSLVFGTKKVTKDIKIAWKNVLFNQFHDIITGALIKTACEDAIFSYGESISVAQRQLNNSIQTISWDIDIPQDLNMIPIVVFNPHSWRGKKIIELESGYIENDSYMLDSKGNEVSMQLIQSEVSAIATTKRQRVTFVADIPSLGYDVYRIFRKNRGIPSLKQPCFKPTKDSKFVLENKNLKVEFNENTGNIKTLYDKINNIVSVNEDFARCIVFGDSSDTWGHGKDRFKNNIGEAKLEKIKIIEDGEVRKIIRVKKRYKTSSVVMDFMLYKDLNYINVKSKVEWNEKQEGLKIQFPLNLKSKESTYSIPYGITKRENNGMEVPSLGWVDYTEEKREKKYGVSIISNNKNSFDVEGNTVSLTVLRNPIFAHLDIKGTRNEYELDEDLDYEYTGKGIHEFEYIVYPHSGDWNNSEVVKIGLELKQKLIGITETYHKGSLKQKDCYVELSSKDVILTVLKYGEDGDGIIARFREINGFECSINVKFNFLKKEWNLNFKPYEIKTIKIDLDSKEVIEVNMLEW